MSAEHHFSDDFLAELDELLRWRRDVRHFDTQPLSPEIVEALVAATRFSPSVGYSQPWRFVSVESRERRETVIASFESANAAALAQYADEDAARYARLKLSGLREAPVHLAVFCDGQTQTGKGLGAQTMPETLRYSAVMAIHTLWLCARARGIGVGWVSILDPSAVTRSLEVPAAWQFIAYLCLGYPHSSSPAPELQRLGWECEDPRSTHIALR